jgi:hypothetical protein
MKLKPILRDSSPNSFYLDNTSITDPYPVLKINDEDINILQEEALSTLINYSNLDFTGLLNLSTLKILADNFGTNHVKTKISERISFQADLFNTYLTTEGTTQNSLQQSILEVSDETREEIKTKALDLGYLNTINEGNSNRITSSYNSDLELVKNIVESPEIYKERRDLNIFELIENSTHIERAWNSIKEIASTDGENLSGDLSRTLGSVVPIFKNVPYKEGYNVLSATAYYKKLNDTNLYKESFNLSSLSSCASKIKDGIQIIWSLPNTEHSLVKIVWDRSIVDSARMTNLKLAKINT